jgi:riboflavin kinase/FMN adenylyltransferase
MRNSQSAARPASAPRADDLPLAVKGVVMRFAGNGRTLGYPTANIDSDTPARDGVYFGFADLAGFRRHPSLIFVGIPTTMGDRTRRVEAHLLDIADEDHYGETLAASLEHYHRPNRTFGSAAELAEAMRADEAAGRRWFAEQAGAAPPDKTGQDAPADGPEAGAS